MFGSGAHTRRVKRIKPSRRPRQLASSVAIAVCLVASSIGFVVATSSAAGASATWGPVTEVPLVGGGDFWGVSCIDADCTAVGFGSARGVGGIYATESDGVWGSATALRNSNPDPTILGGVSCWGAGDCTATGGPPAAYLTEVNGMWGPATSMSSFATSVSCWGAGECIGVDGASSYVTESNGVWGPAVDFPDSVSEDLFNSVSCSDSADCAAVGLNGNSAIYVTKSNGVWGPVTEIPGSGAAFYGVSCSEANDCTAVGKDATGAIYATESDGIWGPVTEIGGGSFVSVGCSDADDCTAVGNDANGAIYAAERDGTWDQVTEFPDSAGDTLSSVSCSGAGSCTAVGSDGNGQPIYVTSNPPPTVTIAPPSLPAISGQVAYTVTVGPTGGGPTPTGSVDVSDNQGGSCTIDTLTSGSGSCSMPESVSAGPYTVTADYSGDSNYALASSSITVSGGVSSGGDASAGSVCVTTSASGGAQDGVDTVTESQYSRDPVGPLTAGTNFFGVALSPDSTFDGVSLQDCNGANSSSVLEWWNPAANGGNGAWIPVESPATDTKAPFGQVFATTPSPSNLSVAIDSDSSPSISQLTGAIFGVSELPPTITKISPTSGKAAGGNSVTITGTYLSGAKVTFRGTTAHLKSDTATTIKVTAPAGGAGAAPVKVTTAGGTATTSYTYIGVPVVTAVSPNSGPLAGTNTVTITGVNLGGASKVAFGATAATRFTAVSSTEILATAPAEAAGSTHVTVTTKGGTSASGTTSLYSFDTFQVNTSISPLHATHHVHYSVTLTTLGASVGATITWAKVGALPASLSLATDGVLSGTPPTVGSSTVKVTAIEKVGSKTTSATGSFSLVVK